MYMIPTEDIVKFNDPIHSKYLAWAKPDKADEEKLVLLGKFDNEGGPTSGRSYKDQYWGEQAAIALAFYPYYGCEIYRYGQDGGLYFVYTEIGGHAAEKRCRLIQRHLILTELPG